AAAALVLSVTMTPSRGKSFEVSQAPVDSPPRATPRDTHPVAVAPAPVTRTPVAVPLSVSNPALSESLDRYAASVRDLERDVAAREAGLSPHTREVVKRSLAAIDSAIADLRTALGASPKDARLGESVTAIYEQKLEFLRRVKALPGEGE